MLNILPQLTGFPYTPAKHLKISYSAALDLASSTLGDTSGIVK